MSSTLQKSSFFCTLAFGLNGQLRLASTLESRIKEGGKNFHLITGVENPSVQGRVTQNYERKREKK